MQTTQLKPKIAISIGDINGVGLEIALREHTFATSICEPIYCAHKELVEKAATLLEKQNLTHIANDMYCTDINAQIPKIKVGQISAKSGAYSFQSFLTGLEMLDSHKAQAIITLPIHKSAWKKAGIKFAGHTQVLSKRYNKQAIMALGNEQMLVGLFSDHIPLKSVSKLITTKHYTKFLLDFYQNLMFKEALVLGFNPHCGDNGAIGGKEDAKIQKAIHKANKILGKEVFIGAIPPDTAFIPRLRERFHIFIAPYHDIGLATLKALYFDSSINISLNIPIIRTSVDHGVAYDIAYQGICSTQSYRNALQMAKKLIQAKYARKTNDSC